MGSKRIGVRALAGLILTAGLCGTATAQTKPEQFLDRQPLMPNVLISTPATPADVASCKVEAREWAAGEGGTKAKGVVVLDGGGRKLRQFIDTSGGTKYNIVSYYLDGVESFREIDSNGNGKPDRFRWLGVNGGKEGVDRDENGRIDTWITLSAEEMTQEVFLALQSKDAERLKALLVTDEDMKSLKLPQVEETRIRKKAEQATARFTKAATDLKLTPKAKWMHAELTPPNTTPRDALGSSEDLVRHKNIAVLMDIGDSKTMSYFSTGEMLQVGRTWKLVDGPAAGTPVDTPEGPGMEAVPDEIKAAVKKLQEIKPPSGPSDMYRYHSERAAVLVECVSGTKGAQQLPWLKQMVDAYAAAVEAAPDQTKTFETFTAWKDQIAQAGSMEIKAYTMFRHTGGEFAVKLKEAGNDTKKLSGVQTWRKESLEKFVKDYPESTDAPEAVMQLAVAAEFASRDPEAAATKWYEKLMKDYASHPHAVKAAGAVRRLGCEGKPFTLTGETLDGKPFTEKLVAGKPVVVLYWASWGTQAVDELKNLAKIEKEFAAKGLQIVTVSLDDDATKSDALAAVTAAKIGGYHLHASGGLDRSPLGTAYGIHMIPHLFLIGKDGKVSSRNAQTGSGLKEDVEKLLK
jgi:hypothetical protein